MATSDTTNPRAGYAGWVGLGLRGVLPTAIAMVNEFARRGRGGSATTILMTDYHVGAVATALLGILLIPRYGWESLFIVGALAALVLVPLLWRYLAESDGFLRVRAGLDAPAQGATKRSVYAHVNHLYPPAARATAVGGAAGFGRLGAISGPLIGGWLLTAGIAYPWGFYIFAVVAAIGALSISMVNRAPAPDEALPITEEEADHASERRTGRLPD